MQKTAPPFPKSEVTVGLAELERYAKGWLLDSEIRQPSPGTLASRRLVVEKLLWFLRQQELSICGTMELRQFLAYLTISWHSSTAATVSLVIAAPQNWSVQLVPLL
jgi:hypothetical protein